MSEYETLTRINRDLCELMYEAMDETPIVNAKLVETLKAINKPIMERLAELEDSQ